MRAVRTLLLPLALAACQQAHDPQVTRGWVRLAAAPGRPAAGYFTLTGGATDATLVSVSSPVAGRVELHESMTMAGGMGAMTMRPLAQVAVPARRGVAFAPGGKHLMIFDVAPGVKPGGAIRLRFSFADGKVLALDARSVAAGDTAPAF